MKKKDLIAMTSNNPLQSYVWKQLEAERHGLSISNWFLLFLILFSLILFTVETEESFHAESHSLFQLVNLVVLLIFALEFSARLYAVGVEERFSGISGRLAYIRAHWIMTTVDFIAFAPELVCLAVGIPTYSGLKALRLLRLFKLGRYFPAFALLFDAVRSCIQELLAALAISVVLWYAASVLLFFAEGDAQPEKFGSIAKSMWWSVITLTTIGYGDVYPITWQGKVISGFIAILGLGTVAMPSGILAGSFIERFREARSQK